MKTITINSDDHAYAAAEHFLAHPRETRVLVHTLETKHYGLDPITWTYKGPRKNVEAIYAQMEIVRV